MNVVAQREFELSSLDAAVQHVNHEESSEVKLMKLDNYNFCLNFFFFFFF